MLFYLLLLLMHHAGKPAVFHRLKMAQKELIAQLRGINFINVAVNKRGIDSLLKMISGSVNLFFCLVKLAEKTR